MTPIDLSFPVFSQQTIPADHGYLLYSAISRILPGFHQTEGLGLHPIAGRIATSRQMQLQTWSSLSIRTTDQRIGELLPLAGKTLRIRDAMLLLGVPRILPLTASSKLRSRLVTIKNGTETDRFSTELRRQLSAINVAESACIHVGKRRTIRIKDKEVVGFEVEITGLNSDESLQVQRFGLGGRRLMTCGVFCAVRSSGE